MSGKKKPSKHERHSGKSSLSGPTEATKPSEGEPSQEELSDEELAGVQGAIKEFGTSTYLDTSDGGHGHGSLTLVSNYVDVGTGGKKKG